MRGEQSPVHLLLWTKNYSLPARRGFQRLCSQSSPFHLLALQFKFSSAWKRVKVLRRKTSTFFSIHSSLIDKRLLCTTNLDVLPQRKSFTREFTVEAGCYRYCMIGNDTWVVIHWTTCDELIYLEPNGRGLCEVLLLKSFVITVCDHCCAPSYSYTLFNKAVLQFLSGFLTPDIYMWFSISILINCWLINQLYIWHVFYKFSNCDRIGIYLRENKLVSVFCKYPSADKLELNCSLAMYLVKYSICSIPKSFMSI